MNTPAATIAQPHGFSLSGRPAPRRVDVDNYNQVGEVVPVSQTLSKGYVDARSRARLGEYQRAQRLRLYLVALLQRGDVSQSTATAAWKAWTMLSDALSGSLIVPDAGATSAGQLLFTWDNNEHHFELEVFPNGIGEFFYLNHRTDEIWEYDYQLGDRLPQVVKDRLSLFVL